MSEIDTCIVDVRGVDTFQWNPRRAAAPRAIPASVNNFGDLLGPVIASRIAKLEGLPARVPTPEQRLVSAGSVMHYARSHDVLWGTGLNHKVNNSAVDNLTLDIRALRGPWSASYLLSRGFSVPAVFGDPALLLPRLFPETVTWAAEPRFDVSCVPNFNDFESYPPQNRVSATGDMWAVIERIARSSFVVGSSLHAVIVADALGIPARFVASDTEHEFKYRDYLSGTGRHNTIIAQTLDEAFELGGHEAPIVDLDALYAAFPRDLWQGQEATGSRPEVATHETTPLIPLWRSHYANVILPRLAMDAGTLAESDLADRVARANDFRVQLLSGDWGPALPSVDTALDDAVRAKDTAAVRRLAGQPTHTTGFYLRGIQRVDGGFFLATRVAFPADQSHSRILRWELRDVDTGDRFDVTIPRFPITERQQVRDIDGILPDAVLSRAERWQLYISAVRPSGEMYSVAMQSVPTEFLTYTDLASHLPESAADVLVQVPSGDPTRTTLVTQDATTHEESQ